MADKIGMVLSGGGVRSIAHIGLIQLLLEKGIVPTQLSGTSGGALVAGLYAAGYEPKEMVEFFKETPILKLSLYALGKPGFMDSEKYVDYFEKYFKRDSFDSLHYPLTITATNLLDGKLEFFSEGELIKPLIASSALPPVFSPIEMKDSLYCDGGVLNNFPIEPLENCDKIIGSFVNPIDKMEKNELNSSLKLLYRVYHIGLDASNFKKFKQCNYVFLPPTIKSVGVLDSRAIDKAYKLGYEYARQEEKNIMIAML